MKMSRRLNRIKLKAFAKSRTRHFGVHGDLRGNLAGGAGPARMPMTTQIPTSFGTDKIFPVPSPPSMLAQPPNPGVTMAPPPDMTATMDIRGGSAPPSPTPQLHPPKPLKQQTLAWFAGRKQFKSRPKPGFWVGAPGPLGQDLEHVPENSNVHLLRGYAVAEEDGQVPLQPRRTLDQYFYSHLDNTARRDKDQVVYRYTKNEEPKIFMVDQMWLWIINGGLSHPNHSRLTKSTDTATPDTLITCIPNRWRDGNWNRHTALVTNLAEDLVRGPSIEHQAPPSLFPEPFITTGHGGVNLAVERPDPFTEIINVEPTNENDILTASRHPRTSSPPAGTGKSTVKSSAPDDPMNIQHQVLQHLKETSRKAVESIYDLAGVIATCCASSFDENQIPEDMQFFDFFESSIGNVVRSTIEIKV